jgi:hypothetical protein
MSAGQKININQGLITILLEVLLPNNCEFYVAGYG